MSKLRIAPELALPAEAVTQTFAILAKRGSGKTYTGAVFAEELLKAALQTVIIDPVGVWWGLRAAANGKDEGLAVLVMGGEHGDLPLEETAGELVADLIVDERQSVMLDVSLMRKKARTRFMTVFLEALYRRNRLPLQLIVDEADAFAPQRPGPDEMGMLGAMEDVVRRGRARGLGCTLITQRPAVLSKNVLTQIEVLVCLRMIAPQDRAAIEAWVEVHGTKEQCEQLMASLPSLDIGEAWFWSPGWLDIFKRVRVRERETFDSSATPKAGAKLAFSPKKLKPMDLEAIREKMAATIEQAKANDPKALQLRIAALERELVMAKRATEEAKSQKPEEKTERREVLIIPPRERQELTDTIAKALEAGRELERVAKTLVGANGLVLDRLDRVDASYAIMQKNLHNSHAPPAVIGDGAARGAVESRGGPRAHSAAAPAGNGAGGLQPRMQALLDGLATFAAIGQAHVDRAQLATFCAKSPNSGSYRNDLGELRSGGWIDYPSGGAVTLTKAGAAIARPTMSFNSAAQLQEAWYRKLQPRLGSIVRELAGIYPAAMSREQLAERLQKSAGSGSFRNDLGELRTLGLIEYPSQGCVSCSALLFPPIG